MDSAYAEIRNKLMTGRTIRGEMPIGEFRQLLDDLEALVLKTPVDKDDKEQWQKDQIQNLTDQITSAREIANPANIYKFAHALIAIIPTLMKR